MPVRHEHQYYPLRVATWSLDMLRPVSFWAACMCGSVVKVNVKKDKTDATEPTQ